jgi:DNA mismatch repair ATPase MutS
MATLSQAAWDAMRSLSEFVAARGDSVGAKLLAWTAAKEAFDDEVRKIESKVSKAKLAAIEVGEAIDRFAFGDLDSMAAALINAQRYLNEVSDEESEKERRDALMDSLGFPSIRGQA